MIDREVMELLENNPELAKEINEEVEAEMNEELGEETEVEDVADGGSSDELDGDEDTFTHKGSTFKIGKDKDGNLTLEGELPDGVDEEELISVFEGKHKALLNKKNFDVNEKKRALTKQERELQKREKRLLELEKRIEEKLNPVEKTGLEKLLESDEEDILDSFDENPKAFIKSIVDYVNKRNAENANKVTVNNVNSQEKTVEDIAIDDDGLTYEQFDAYEEWAKTLFPKADSNNEKLYNMWKLSTGTKTKKKSTKRKVKVIQNSQTDGKRSDDVDEATLKRFAGIDINKLLEG